MLRDVLKHVPSKHVGIWPRRPSLGNARQMISTQSLAAAQRGVCTVA